MLVVRFSLALLLCLVVGFEKVWFAYRCKIIDLCFIVIQVISDSSGHLGVAKVTAALNEQCIFDHCSWIHVLQFIIELIIPAIQFAAGYVNFIKCLFGSEFALPFLEEIA